MSKISDQTFTPTQQGVDADLHEKHSGSQGDKRNIEKEADEFSSKLKDKDFNKEDGGDQKQKMSEKSLPRSPGGAILESMQSQIKGGDMKAEAQGTRLSDTINEIVDKLLVSESSLSGKDEIRISLKESVLPGTEVRISKDGGAVRIELVTTSDQSFQLLTSEKSVLENNLKDRLKDNVSVEVRFNESGREDNEGRSRQQRNIVDEQED